MDPPAQDIQAPTYHPYNLLRLPRRLDYIFLSGMHSGERGGLHDAVAALREDAGAAQARKREYPRQLRDKDEVAEYMESNRGRKGDSLQNLQ